MRSLLVAGLFLSVGCSSVTYQYRRSDFLGDPQTTVKRIRVGAWSSNDREQTDHLMRSVAEDLLRLRKNLLVYPASNTRAQCDDSVDAVLMLRELESQVRDNSVSLRLSAELQRCADGAIVWRAEAEDERASGDENLSRLTQNYERRYAQAAPIYAAPFFGVLQELVAELPDTVLNDDDIEEKIELEAELDS